MSMLQCDIFYTPFGNNEIPDDGVLIKKKFHVFSRRPITQFSENLEKFLKSHTGTPRLTWLKVLQSS